MVHTLFLTLVASSAVLAAPIVIPDIVGGVAFNTGHLRIPIPVNVHKEVQPDALQRRDLFVDGVEIAGDVLTPIVADDAPELSPILKAAIPIIEKEAPTIEKYAGQAWEAFKNWWSHLN